jgi:histone H3/H4
MGLRRSTSALYLAAKEALQYGAGDHLVTTLEEYQLAATHAERKTIKKQDMHIMRHSRSLKVRMCYICGQIQTSTATNAVSGSS